jgi:membrane associated rhomboid family serine protease
MLRFAKVVRDHLTALHAAFSHAFNAFLVVLVPSSLLFVLTSIYPQLYELLSASRSTPWGVVTSIFVHYNLLHIVGNMGLLFAFLLLFAEPQQDLPSIQKHKRSFFFAWNIFFSGILANILFILLSPGSAAGASGVVFASEGVTMGFALLLALPPRLSKEAIRKHFLDKQTRRLSVRGLAIFSILLVFLVAFPSNFLAAAPGVNIFVHFAGFYISFVSVIIFRLAGRFRY